MDQEITDIFAEYENTISNDLILELNSPDADIHPIKPWRKHSAPSRIFCLSDVFLEWYLFDSDNEKNIKTFLELEGLTDIFTEQQFMDLMCGKAYLDDTNDSLINFIALKTPFYISTGKLIKLNSMTHKPGQYMIKNNLDIANQSAKIKTQKKEKIREKKNANKKIYYTTNKKIIAEKSKIYRETHREEIKARKKLYQETHKEEIAERRKKYRETNKEKIRAKNKKYRLEHPELDKQRAQKPQRKKYMQEYHKRYAEQNSEAVQKQKKAWYEANKERLAEQDKERRQKLKQSAESAQKICAAYVFLLALRKSDYKQYLELYTSQQKPLINMLKVCPALQSMDINLCPLCNPDCENNLCECCNQKVLTLPNIIPELQRIATELQK